MMADNALDMLQVMLRICGDAGLRKGRTQKFQSGEVHSTENSVIDILKEMLQNPLCRTVERIALGWRKDPALRIVGG